MAFGPSPLVRFLYWLFPYVPPRFEQEVEEDMERKGYAVGSLDLDNFVTLGWADWFRVLVSRKILFCVRAKTKPGVDEAYSVSTISVMHPWYKYR